MWPTVVCSLEEECDDPELDKVYTKYLGKPRDPADISSDTGAGQTGIYWPAFILRGLEHTHSIHVYYFKYHFPSYKLQKLWVFTPVAQPQTETGSSLKSLKSKSLDGDTLRYLELTIPILIVILYFLAYSEFHLNLETQHNLHISKLMVQEKVK